MLPGPFYSTQAMFFKTHLRLFLNDRIIGTIYVKLGMMILMIFSNFKEAVFKGMTFHIAKI